MCIIEFQITYPLLHEPLLRLPLFPLQATFKNMFIKGYTMKCGYWVETFFLFLFSLGELFWSYSEALMSCMIL